MIAYLDESYDSKRTVYSIAGFVSPEYLWTRFEGQWREHLKWAGVKAFHANKFEHGLDEYSGWSTAKRTDFMERLLETIHGTITLGIGQTMIMEDYNRIVAPIAKTGRQAAQRVGKTGKRKVARSLHIVADLFSHPYVYLLQSWMQQVSKRLPLLPVGEKISCVFEQNFEVEGTVRKRIARLLYETEILAGAGHLAGGNPMNLAEKFSEAVTFAPRETFLPLQAADLLVYETHLDMLNKAQGDHRPQRPVLKELLSRHRVITGYHDEDTIRASFKKVDKWVAEYLLRRRITSRPR
jgi:hypothetical protein